MSKSDHSKGPLKCPRCPKRYSDKGWYDAHVKTHEADPVSPPAPVSPPESGGVKEDAGDTAGFEYPTLADWRHGSGAVSPSGASSGPSVPATGAGLGPSVYHFQLGPMWSILGDFVDGNILKNKRFKVDMTPAKARDLDASLAQVGFVVETPGKPITIPWWAPLGFSIIVTFVLPIVASIVLDKWGEWRAKKAEDAAKKAAPPPEPKREDVSAPVPDVRTYTYGGGD